MLSSSVCFETPKSHINFDITSEATNCMKRTLIWSSNSRVWKNHLNLGTCGAAILRHHFLKSAPRHTNHERCLWRSPWPQVWTLHRTLEAWVHTVRIGTKEIFVNEFLISKFWTLIPLFKWFTVHRYKLKMPRQLEINKPYTSVHPSNSKIYFWRDSILCALTISIVFKNTHQKKQ